MSATIWSAQVRASRVLISPGGPADRGGRSRAPTPQARRAVVAQDHRGTVDKGGGHLAREDRMGHREPTRSRLPQDDSMRSSHGSTTERDMRADGVAGEELAPTCARQDCWSPAPPASCPRRRVPWLSRSPRRVRPPQGWGDKPRRANKRGRAPDVPARTRDHVLALNARHVAACSVQPRSHRIATASTRGPASVPTAAPPRPYAPAERLIRRRRQSMEGLNRRRACRDVRAAGNLRLDRARAPPRPSSGAGEAVGCGARLVRRWTATKSGLAYGSRTVPGPAIYESSARSPEQGLRCRALVADTGGLRESCGGGRVGLPSPRTRRRSGVAEQILTDDALRDRLVARRRARPALDWADVARQTPKVYAE